MIEHGALPSMRGPLLVVGGYGYRNVGDEAMLAGLVQALGQTRVTVLSRAPAETAALHGVGALPLRAAGSALRTHRTVLIGGGALFDRDMGALGRLLPAFGLAARSLGHPLVIAGVSLDPDLPASRLFAVRALFRRASWVGVRDTTSATLLARWGVRSVVQGDLSDLMVAPGVQTGRSLLRAAGLDASRPVVGLALTALNRPIARRLPGLVEALSASMPAAELCFIPMSQHPFVAAHNDLLLGRALQRHVPRLRLLEGVVDPGAMLSIFQALSAAVCMRYHSFVFAERAGIGFTGFAYAPKVTAWLTQRGLQAAELSAAEVLARLEPHLAPRSLAS